VGFFVLLAVMILSMIVFQIGGLAIFSTRQYELNVIFDFVNGISKDAPVQVAGVAVGQVKNVVIFYNTAQKKTQVRLLLLVDTTVKIPKDSVAYINTLGILGEKYVEIVPGEDQQHFLGENDFVTGNNPVQLEKLTESLVDIIGDQTGRDSLRDCVYNVRIATENLRQTTEMLNEAVAGVKSGKGTLGRFINDDSIYTQTEALITNANQKLDKTITDLNVSLNDLIADLKSHPWKLFQKPARQPDKKSPSAAEKDNADAENRGVIYQKK
ncbi:MAG: MlaD family protein, partial [Saprospiraceae bacterium]|nr:MlaD family protein [Saprospiraceae bacterium]